MRAISPFLRFLARDISFVILMAFAWRADGDMRAAHAGELSASAVAVVAGLLTTLVGFFAHEWGHLLGALSAGGIVLAPRRLYSPFLFFFDVAKSDRRAFLMMSYGGYAASVVALAAILLSVPWRTLSGVTALVATSLGVLATFAIEVPTTVRVARGGPLPSGGVFADESGHPSAGETSARPSG
jgi:hypothetical protein